ncbi:hypothetical protein ACJX0J_005369, partial [Zea mays]
YLRLEMIMGNRFLKKKGKNKDRNCFVCAFDFSKILLVWFTASWLMFSVYMFPPPTAQSPDDQHTFNKEKSGNQNPKLFDVINMGGLT